jgi:hypothetical protein
MTMDYYAGIDVSLEASSVCVVDGAGKIAREAKIASEPAALIAWFASLGFDLTRIGLEAGPLSQWLYAALKEACLAVELLETRHARVALQTMPVKTDRNDARHRATDAARLVPPGPLQVDGGAGDAGVVDGAQAGSIEALRYRDESARDVARLRAEGRADDAKALCATDRGTRRRPCKLGGHREGAALGPCGFVARVRHVRETCAGNGAAGQARAADNVGAGRRADHGADLRCRDRRSVTVFVLEAGWTAFWPDAAKISVRRDGRDRTDHQDRRRRRARRAL